MRQQQTRASKQRELARKAKQQAKRQRKEQRRAQKNSAGDDNIGYRRGRR